MSFGLLPQGFVPKTQTDIVTSLDAKARAAIGQSLDISARSLLGQLVTIFAGELAEPWEAIEDVYSSRSPDMATGAALVDLASVTGTTPEGAESSTVTETLTGTAGTPIAAGFVVSVQDRTDSRFATAEDTALVAVSSWQTSHAYALGARAKNGGKVYQCTQAGTSAASGGPSGTGTTIIDGSVVWTYLGDGDGAVDVSMLSEKQDVITAPARTLSRIETPILGVSSAINLLDADVGHPAEEDSDLRLRRELELRASGNASLDSIRAKVSAVNGVQSVSVFQNDTDETNGDGIPPHSVEVVVDLDAGPPSDVEDLIRSAIFQSVAAGIRSYGTESGSVVDASGNSQTVAFSYLEEVPAYVTLELEVTSDFPSDGDALVTQKLLEFEAQRLVGGYDLVAAQIAAIAFEVEGVFNIADVQVGETDPASGNRVSVNTRQKVTLDTGRISVSHTVVTP